MFEISDSGWLDRKERVLTSSVAEEYAESETKLYNSKPPNLGILHEKPEHRIIILLKAQGKSNRDIYRAFGGTFDTDTGEPKNDGQYTQPHLSQVCRQPWARAAILREIHENTANGGSNIQALLSSEVDDSIYTLVELRDRCKDTDPAVARGCANDLLDRFLGKPTQHVQTQAKVQHTMGDIASVEKDIAETQQELARLVGETKTA